MIRLHLETRAETRQQRKQQLGSGDGKTALASSGAAAEMAVEWDFLWDSGRYVMLAAAAEVQYTVLSCYY